MLCLLECSNLQGFGILLLGRLRRERGAKIPDDAAQGFLNVGSVLFVEGVVSAFRVVVGDVAKEFNRSHSLRRKVLGMACAVVFIATLPPGAKEGMVQAEGNIDQVDKRDL